MPFKKGQSGNPDGGPPGSKLWRDAVRLAVHRRDKDGGKLLNQLADKLVDFGINGDVSALREIGDRLDGKPMQTAEIAIRPMSHEEALAELE